ncbi:hypothetical protein HDU93_002753 [Gonapodya sp. JEL0774]|nr:hypothetical protein HDU93_002753 [Gonapodya sp. JEL0774]
MNESENRPFMRDITRLSRKLTSKSQASEIGVSPGLSRRLTTKSQLSEIGLQETEVDSFLKQLKNKAAENGYDQKEATLIWRDIRVVGSKSLVKTSPVDNSATLLHPTSGFVRPGEMLLVLGKPGAGAGPLVRVIGKTPERLKKLYSEVDGDITINGIASAEFKVGSTERPRTKPQSGIDERASLLGSRNGTRMKYFTVAVSKFLDLAYPCYFQATIFIRADDDLHIASLTVRQTLSAALNYKIGHTNTDRGVEGVREDHLNFLQEWLGLKGAMDTVVGNEFLRGVSGGEKKRVSIAEQLTGSAAINVWDQTTKGLDATYALQVMKGFRLMTTALGRTTIVHINQTSDSIYRVFDRVLLLSHGRTIYCGPTSTAQAYFQKLGFRPLPRQSVPDFINSVTEVNERVLAEGVDPSTVPSTALEFEKAWLASEDYHAMMRDLGALEQKLVSNKSAETFHAAETAFREENFSSTIDSVRSRTTWEQFKMSLSREFNLMRGQPTLTIGTLLFVLILGLCMGTMAIRLPLTPIGAFTRGGAVFFSLLLNTIQTQTDIPRMVAERSYVYKHKEWTFYRAGVRYMAWVVADIPVRILASLMFTLFYWTTGLNPDPVRFVTFLLFNFFAGACYSSFSRFITAISPDINVALRLNSIWLIPNLIYCGYMIPYSEVKPWFIWFVWISPLAYSFRALMGNEFRGLTFECAGDYVVPPYSGVSDTYKTCNMQGAKPGSMMVDGSDYVQSTYGFDASSGTVWWNFGAVVGLWFVFLMLSVIVSEFAEFGGSGINRMIFQKSRSSGNDRSEKKRSASEQTIVEMDIAQPRSKGLARMSTLKMTSNLSLTWSNLSYWIPSPTGERQLLDNISGTARPGRMVALMGFTGAGKTTLQDVLTRRKAIGRIDGTVFVGASPQTSGFKRILGYAEQMDLHTATATVREALRFSAYLRQPAEVSLEEKNQFVEEIIDLIGLNDIADALVGKVETGVGINLTDRKRLTIAIELCARPEFLVADEPTSGLDSYAAFQIVKLLRKLADKGQAIVCTIHQPSAILFEHFDDLLLLGPGGRTLYFGEIGAQSTTVTRYFEKRGAALYNQAENPAEYVLDAGNGLRNADTDAEIDWVDLWRTSDEAKSLESTISELRNVPVDEDAQEIQKNEFSLTTIQMSLPYMNDLKTRFARESAQGFYNWFAFSVAVSVVEVLFSAIQATTLFVLFYFLSGLSGSSSAAITFWLFMVFLIMFAVSLGQWIAALMPTLPLATMLVALVTTFLSALSGIAVPEQQSKWMVGQNYS